MASQRIEPAYRGAVWIDKATARVLRIEMGAVGLPEALPLDKAESTAGYGFVRLGTIPVHAEMLTCQRGTYRCNLNKIDFRKYQKYAGGATLTFEDKPRP